MIKCMVFLREKGEIERKRGLGTHPFGRIPIEGEYVSLEDGKPVYQVARVHHTGFGHHAAELYVVEAEDVVMLGGEPLPPA